MTRDEMLAAVGPVLVRHTGVRVGVVFGSVARRSAGAHSDLDLAVLGDVDVLELAAELSRVLQREVDVVRLTSVTIPVLDAIVRDGIVVFERTPGLAALWRSRALASLEIDRPWYERMQNAWLKRVAERGVLGQ